ncbi:S8 family serine peptidase [Bacillus velezensis]|uniref:S8 family serine peptidase n=1 Tax=Bacillus velezensis TaxID=492670 RepID=UPI003A7F7752
MSFLFLNSDNLENSEGIKVAILDSGINKDNKELRKFVVKEFNALNQNQKINDDYNHGTAIAGIISLNVDKRMVEQRTKIEISDVKVLDKNGNGDVSSLIKAIDWCISENIKIINISSGVQDNSKELQSVIQKALSKGIIIIAASGNNYGLSVDYPAKYQGVLSINALNQNYSLSDFSATGKIDYAMPGSNIKSINNKNEVASFTGTSFATAYATRIITTVIAHQQKNINYLNIREILSPFTFKLGNDNEKRKYGYGHLKN